MRAASLRLGPSLYNLRESAAVTSKFPLGPWALGNALLASANGPLLRHQCVTMPTSDQSLCTLGWNCSGVCGTGPKLPGAVYRQNQRSIKIQRYQPIGLAYRRVFQEHQPLASVNPNPISVGGWDRTKVGRTLGREVPQVVQEVTKRTR